MPHGAQRLGPGPVGGEAGEVLCILGPGDGGGPVLFSQHPGGLASARDTSRAGAAGSLRVGIDLPSAIGVGSGIERGLHQVLPGHAMGPAPLQYPLRGAFPPADPEVDLMLPQRTQERMPGAEFVNLANDQPDHMVHLRIRSIDHLAGCVVHITNGECKAQRPPARRLQGALIPA
jgi:hypothetical protein